MSGDGSTVHIAKHCDCWSDILVHPPARAYLEREQAQGKSRREAIRCLKRQLARVVFNTIKASPA